MIPPSKISRRLLIPLGLIACALYLVLFFVATYPKLTVAASSEADEAAAARTAYSNKVAEKYNDHFSNNAHFLPSLMTTDTGEFIDPKLFPTAQYCGHCHQEAQHQWRQSAHSNANRAPWYLRNVNLLNDGKGVEYSRHCEGCHDPVALVAGNLTQGSTKRRPFDADGVTCAVCHAIQKVDTRGTGSYVLGVPAVLVDENGKAITRPVSDGEILAHLDRHSAAVMKPFYKSSEFCAACHKAALPRELNGYKWQRAISLYDEWQNSAFSRQSPLPFYVKDSVSTCDTCHMMREPIRLPDPGAKNGLLASHRWLGANTIVPKFYQYDEQAERIVRFLQDNVFNVDLFAIEHNGQPVGASSTTVSAPLGMVSYNVAPGELLTADVVIQNKGIAHSYVPEQRDMYESWIDFTVKDSAGKVLFESGFLKPNGDLDERAHSFTNRLINSRGGLNLDHEVWDTRIVAYNNTIQSGRSQIVRYSFHMPPASVGPVTLTASVKYRRFDQHFMDFGMNMPSGKHYEEPVINMVSTSRTLVVGTNHPVPPSASENKEWMRWNNYGIALLDAEQYAASVDAFAHVAKLRPDYADACTNQAIVEIQWQKYADAGLNLQQALKLSPDNSRALYYRALLERNEGNLDGAITDLQHVAHAFPRSGDAHRELGFSFYQQHKYAMARAEYEDVQTIDPDDLAAHYMLAILYRRLGLKDKASQQSAIFADHKDDPTANSYALEYLRKHLEVASESVVWHTHDLDAPANHIAGPIPTTFSGTEN
ncbi:MAG: tetratricopeptide repeat protein [Edaphobacter sp.]